MSIVADAPAACGVLSTAPRASRELLWCRLLAVVVVGAFLVYFGAFCFAQWWGGDFQVYSAALSRLYENLWHPVHETIDAPGVQSFTYSPYLLLVALGGKLAGVTPYRALQCAGVFNLVLFVATAGAFFRQHSLHRRWEIPLCCFLFATLCLRWTNFGWSSETTLVNLQYTQAYPSTFAWALAFLSFALVKPVIRSWNVPALLGLSATLAVLFVTHVLTGSWVIGILGVYGLHSAVAQKSHVPLTRLLAALALAGGLSLLWPYPATVGEGSLHIQEGSHFGRNPIQDLKNLYWAALPCAAYLYGRLRKHEVWVYGFMATLAALWLWRRLGVEYGNRYTFFAAFVAQFAVAEAMAFGVFALARPLGELPSERKWPALDRPVAIGLLVASLLASVPSPMYSEHRAELRLPLLESGELSPHDAYYTRYSDLRAHLQKQDIVMCWRMRPIFDLAALSGTRFVNAPFLVRVPDAAEREEDMRSFYDPNSSSDTRDEIVQRRGVTKIILLPDQFAIFEDLREQYGDPLYRDSEWALFSTVSRAGSAEVSHTLR